MINYLLPCVEWQLRRHLTVFFAHSFSNRCRTAMNAGYFFQQAGCVYKLCSQSVMGPTHARRGQGNVHICLHRKCWGGGELSTVHIVFGSTFFKKHIYICYLKRLKKLQYRKLRNKKYMHMQLLKGLELSKCSCLST